MTEWTTDPRTGFRIRNSGSAPGEPAAPKRPRNDIGQGALRQSAALKLDDLTNHQVWLANRAAAIDLANYEN
jgi:hypothetical protein